MGLAQQNKVKHSSANGRRDKADGKIEAVVGWPGMHRLRFEPAAWVVQWVGAVSAHTDARSLIRPNFSVARLPFRTIVARFRSSRGKIIALATAERSFIVP
jgi:hypothetical protein